MRGTQIYFEDSLGREALAALVSLLADQSDRRHLRLFTSMACQVPEVHTQLQELIGLAAAAGISHEGPSALQSAMMLDGQLDQLLAHPGGRKASEVLDPEDMLGIDYGALLKLAGARLHAAEDEISRQRLKKVIHRLEVGAVEWEDRKAKRKRSQG